MDAWRRVQWIYLTLTLLSTLAASLIWGINTLFLLDAGLSNAEAFGANAAFTAGMLLFEIPTGVVADTRGRRASYLLGAATLLVSTLLYLLMWELQGPLLGWVGASILIGVGFAFFSGATEAWLVDALDATGYDQSLESMFAKGQVVTGIAMLSGSVAGGFIAQATNLGVPYVARAALLGLTFAVAWWAMHDLGFEGRRSGAVRDEVAAVFRASIRGGLGNRPVRWMMLEAPFTAGVGIFVFYAMQPYLLELYGDPDAFGIAGLAAAIVAGSQIVGGFAVPLLRRLVSYRTTVFIGTVVVSVLMLVGMGLVDTFWPALVMLVVWAMSFAAALPMRRAYLNGLIASEERATVLSFDSLMGSAGGVVAQPALGRIADVSGYGASYVVSGALTALALPFVLLARREQAPSDPILRGAPAPGSPQPVPPQPIEVDPDGQRLAEPDPDGQEDTGSAD
ncbi:MAG: MFS transporter [Nitriliruptorales bacterium]|nr:MFS transporter [Nitriliruptorales bacterium]